MFCGWVRLTVLSFYLFLFCTPVFFCGMSVSLFICTCLVQHFNAFVNRLWQTGQRARVILHVKPDELGPCVVQK